MFFEPSKARAILAETVDVDDTEAVAYMVVPQYSAVLVYVTPDGRLPELYSLLGAASALTEHNKIVASHLGGRLHLVVARDERLLLCNSFEAADFTTAEYFIFLVMRKFQLNPEVSSIHFNTPLTAEQETSLLNYFSSVKHLNEV